MLSDADKTAATPAAEDVLRRLFAGTIHNIGNVVTVARLAVSELQENQAEVNSAIVNMLLDELLPPLEAEAARHEDFACRDHLQSMRELLEHQRREFSRQARTVASLHAKLSHVSDIIVLQRRLLSAQILVENLDLRECVEAALGLMQEAAARHHVEFARDYGAAPPARGDRAILTQVFVNLLKNAIEALEEVVDRPRQVHLRIGRGGQQDGRELVVCEVADNGPGLDTQHLQRVFDFGYSTKGRADQGGGVGLHFCRDAVARLHGSIEVAANDSGGACFVVRLPAGDPPRTEDKG